MGVLDYLRSSSRSDITWRTGDRVILIACLLLTVWYASLGYLDKPGKRVRGIDSIGYYVYLPSVIIDGDLELANDFQKLNPGAPLFAGHDGRTGNIFSVGPAILWSPWFLIGHVTAKLSSYDADGYTQPYMLAVYLGNLCYVVVGLLFVLRALKSFDLPPLHALIATSSVLLATQLTYYIFPKSLTSHGVSFFATAAFLLSIRRRGISWQSGLLGGLAMLIRWQNAVFLPLLGAASYFSTTEAERQKLTPRAVVVCLLSAGIVFLPQVLVWQILYGVPFLVPQDDGYLDPTRLPVLDVVFSIRHGLATWHPWWILGAAGLIISQKAKPWRIAFLGCVCIQIFVNAMVHDWWGNWAFGNRRFLSSLPFFAIGIGYLLHVSSGDIRRVVFVLLAGLALWNQAFVFQYQRVLIPRNRPPTWTEFAYDKLQLPTVWQAQLYVNTAVHSLRRGDFENYLEFAERAGDSYETYRNSMKVHSVAASLQGKWERAVTDYEGWLAIEPWSIAARWGLADLRLKLGQVDEARGLIEELSVEDAEVSTALAKGKGALLTNAFFTQYRKELDQIYTE